jgi:hypothetical protein
MECAGLTALLKSGGPPHSKELLQHLREFFEIVNKAPMFEAAGFIIRRTKN